MPAFQAYAGVGKRFCFVRGKPLPFLLCEVVLKFFDCSANRFHSGYIFLRFVGVEYRLTFFIQPHIYAIWFWIICWTTQFLTSHASPPFEHHNNKLYYWQPKFK